MSQANTWHEEYFQDIIVDPDNILKPFDADEPLIKIYDNLPVYCARIDNQVFVVFGREKFGPYDDVKFFKKILFFLQIKNFIMWQKYQVNITFFPETIAVKHLIKSKDFAFVMINPFIKPW